MDTKSNVYWGDAHLNLEGNHFHRIDEVFQAARQHLDFFPIAYYPFYWYAQGGLPDVIASGEGFVGGYQKSKMLPIETVGQRKRFLQEWRTIQQKVREYHKPGEFVTFEGYEWHGDRQSWGDHNVFFKETGPLLCPSTLAELYAAVEKQDGIVIPHHTGYALGQRGKNWDVFREQLSPFVEVYSVHGSSEGIETPVPMSSNQSMGPRVSAGTVQSGLNRGLRFGLMASSDRNLFPGEWGCGLMGVYAQRLTREALWDAFKARRVFGVTGDRIVPSFEINGEPMGSVVPATGTQLKLRADVIGSHAIDRIEVIGDGRPISTHPFGHRLHTGPSPDGRYKLRVQCGWGPDTSRGFPDEPMRWECRLELRDGEVVEVETAFTDFGQGLKTVENDTVEWELETRRCPGAAFGDRYPSIIVTFAGSLTTEVQLTINGQRYVESVGTLRGESKAFALHDQAKQEIERVFGLTAEDISNPDHFWHYAPKVKIHRIVASDEYTAAIEPSIEVSASYYYLRLTQTNRQMAWTSPIWIQ